MLPTLIEYLCAQELPLGGRLCHPCRVSAIIVLPPNFRLSLQLLPIGWAGIKYAAGGAVIPETLAATTYQAGDMYASGLATAEQFIEIMGYYIVFTHASPIETIIENITNLNQQFTFTQWQLIIDTEEHFNYLRQHLREFSSYTSNELAREANKLLTEINRKMSQGRI